MCMVFLAALDYSLAFDHVVPAAISLGMEHVGLPKALSSVVLDQWTPEANPSEELQHVFQTVMHRTVDAARGRFVPLGS